MTREVRCPKCGRRTTIRMAREDDIRYHVCINFPRCKGRVPVEDEIDEGWGGDWGRAKPSVKPDGGRVRRMEQPYPPSEGGGVIRRAGGGEIDSDTGHKHPARRAQASIDHNLGYDWGDDWGREGTAPKKAPYMPQYPRAQKRAASSEMERAPRSPSQKSKSRITAEKKEPSISRKRAAGADRAASRQEVISEDAMRAVSTPQPALKEHSYDVKSAARWRERRVSQEHLSPSRKKRSLPVIILALFIAFLAIDGMIYAAFVMRNHDTSSPSATPTPVTMSYQQITQGPGI